MYKALTLVMLVLFTNVSSAQDFTFTSLAKPAYLGGNGAIFYDGWVSHNDLFMTWDSGVYADIWTSVSNGSKGDFGNEVDAKLGYKTVCGQFTCAVDVQFLAVSGINVWNLNTELEYKNSFLRVEIYRPAKSGGPAKGTLTSLGFRHGFPLSSKTTFVLQEWIMHDTGAFGFDEGLLAFGYAGFDVILGEESRGITTTVGIKGVAPLTVHDSREADVVLQGGIILRW